MLGRFNILGFVYESRKVLVVLLALGSAVGVGSWGLYRFHYAVLDSYREENLKIKKELTACKNRATDEFVTENRSVFDAYRKEIKEMEDEEIVIDEFNSSNYDWMYQ